MFKPFALAAGLLVGLRRELPLLFWLAVGLAMIGGARLVMQA